MEKDLELRTKRFALAVIKFSSSLPRTRELDVLARQLVRAATSIGANYREANRGVSRADFANKIGTVQKEAAETQYWLELPGVRGQRTEITTEGMKDNAN